MIASKSGPGNLSWYESDNAGTKTNIARLLNHGKLAEPGKLVILPVDQGPGAWSGQKFRAQCRRLQSPLPFSTGHRCRMQCLRGPLDLSRPVPATAGRIPPILKINSHDVLHDEKDPMPSVTGSVQDALRGMFSRGVHDLSRLVPLQSDKRWHAIAVLSARAGCGD